LAGFDVDIQELLEAVLTHDGYLVSIFAADTSSVDEVARASPQAVILSTGVSTGPIRLLDALLVPAGCRRAGRAERELMLRWTQQIRLVEPFRDLAAIRLASSWTISPGCSTRWLSSSAEMLHRTCSLETATSRHGLARTWLCAWRRDCRSMRSCASTRCSET
jgi:hypothetical protein